VTDTTPPPTSGVAEDEVAPGTESSLEPNRTYGVKAIWYGRLSPLGADGPTSKEFDFNYPVNHPHTIIAQITNQMVNRNNQIQVYVNGIDRGVLTSANYGGSLYAMVIHESSKAETVHIKLTFVRASGSFGDSVFVGVDCLDYPMGMSVFGFNLGVEASVLGWILMLVGIALIFILRK
jgi:hypothetical protein